MNRIKVKKNFLIALPPGTFFHSFILDTFKTTFMHVSKFFFISNFKYTHFFFPHVSYLGNEKYFYYGYNYDPLCVWSVVYVICFVSFVLLCTNKFFSLVFFLKRCYKYEKRLTIIIEFMWKANWITNRKVFFYRQDNLLILIIRRFNVWSLGRVLLSQILLIVYLNHNKP